MNKKCLIFCSLLLFGCLEKPAPWVPGEIWGDVPPADALDHCATNEVGNNNDESSSEAEQTDDEDADSSKGDDFVEIDLGGTDADDALVDGQDEADAPDCPLGYVWKEEESKCVSFCPADQYYELNVGKCVAFPCCDVDGNWELSVLDQETMLFDVYSLTLNQQVSYLLGVLTVDSPFEIIDCAGILEDKDFTLSCPGKKFTLVLTSGTTTDASVVGFYSYQYKDGSFKNGSFNMKVDE